MAKNAPTRSAVTLFARLTLGLFQGVLLYWTLTQLNRAEPRFGFEEGDSWGHFISISRLVAWLAPLPLLFGLGRLPALRLAVWSATALGLLLVFGWYGPATVWESFDALINVSLFSLIVLFILHEFVQSAADDNRPLADYRTYFENAWGAGFQAALAFVFLGAYWVVIGLGAWMFDLIGLDFIRRAIFSSKFAWASSGVAFALGAHLAGAEVGLARGARQIGLTLLSWLTVLMTAILTVFLAALLFTGLEPLWNTGRATVLLLNAGATMIFLINAAYQDGRVANTAVMRAVVRFAAAPLAGVVALAALGLWLRVNQYGLTPARVLAAAELVIIALYAIGYVAAALKPGRWMALAEPVNVGVSLAVAAILTGLMTPILSPARISVADQLARLERGRVAPDEFDFGFLAGPRAGEYGEAALARLAERSGTPRDERIALLAKNPGAARFADAEQTIAARRDALRLIGAGEIPDGVLMPRSDDDPVVRCLEQKRSFDARVAETAKILATPAQLRPKDFVATVSKDLPLADGRCLVRLIDMDFDGDEDAVIVSAHPSGLNGAAVLLQEVEPAWRVVGSTSLRISETSPDADIPEITRSDDDAVDERERARIADWFARAVAVPAPIKDLTSLGERFQLRLERRALSDVEISQRLSFIDGAAPPAGPFTNRPDYSVLDGCRRVENDSSGRRFDCFGRYLDLTGDGVNEFLIVGISTYAANIVAFTLTDAGWTPLGETSYPMHQRYEAFAREFGDFDLEPPRQSETDFRDAFIADLQIAPPLVGDLRYGEIQLMTEYDVDTGSRIPLPVRRSRR